ncbi:hypothetical protein DI383_10205 [Flavobacteriaceae bacterium LYZ1037]|nr:hypothetical protein DI383_10205 [Flavobacteriaceae bacterium LYZ1037]
MKNTLTYFVLPLLLLTTTFSFGQEIETQAEKRVVKNEISFEVLQLINGVYQLSYERYVWNNFSAAIAIRL